MTSSVAAVFGYADDLPAGFYFTEKDWNKSSDLSHGPYYFSKLSAELAAWVLPPFSYHPLLLLLHPPPSFDLFIFYIYYFINLLLFIIIIIIIIIIIVIFIIIYSCKFFFNF